MNREMDEVEIAALRKQLLALDLDRQRLAGRLEELQRARVEPPRANSAKPTVTSSSPAAEKIALLLQLFGGRTDVYPTRFPSIEPDYARC